MENFSVRIEMEHVKEIYVEQAFLNYGVSDNFSIKGGLLLVPMGIINEYHEPTTYNGVERPSLNNKLVPTTWREMGIGATGRINSMSLKYQAYIMNGFVSYNWNTNPIQTTQTITTSTPGTYIVTIENTNGCFLNKTFTIIGSEIATLIDININDFSENNSATIIVGGTGNYEFSLDGINYQESAVFNNLEAALYHVYIKDKNGCGIITDTFYILDYPNFFTPNNDGYNDTWQVNNLDKRDLKESKIYIFDRYGKLLKELSPLGNGWNGIFNGNILPASDYWFILELTNGKTVKGHFALKR